MTSMSKIISGFSKRTKEEKINWLATHYFANQPEIIAIIKQYWNSDDALQQLHDDFIENTISNFYLPYGVAPNFIINNKAYVIPMVIEESSVVAAASLVAKFWSTRGGFKAEVISTTKIGQVHFIYKGDKNELTQYFNSKKELLKLATASITKNMEKRGGGILDIELIDKTEKLAHYYQLHITFETVDSMGANFINSCLEAIAKEFRNNEIEIVMSILSNYVPECLVRAEVSCTIEELGGDAPQKFAEKFYQAVQIASIEPYRAVTHNKGIMNGIDAVVLATGNDFRAVEAAVHAFASSDGNYKGLSQCSIIDNKFKISLKIPVSVGTVGGITDLHPMVKLSHRILGNPSSTDLMKIICSVGLAQNFSAVKSLVTLGIQKGHMKMHLINLLMKNNASKIQIENAKEYFKNKEINNQTVIEFLNLKEFK